MIRTRTTAIDLEKGNVALSVSFLVLNKALASNLRIVEVKGLPEEYILFNVYCSLLHILTTKQPFSFEHMLNDVYTVLDKKQQRSSNDV